MSDPANSVPAQTGRPSGLTRIIGWARPLATVEMTTYCGVTSLDHGGSVTTSCCGRWSCKEPMHFIDGRESERDEAGARFTKCGACERTALEQRTRDGLRELRGALAIETRPLVIGVDAGFDPPSVVIGIEGGELVHFFDFSDTEEG